MIRLSELEKYLAVVLDAARNRGVESIEMPEHGAYWTVTSSSWTRIYENPELGVGSFSNDVLELEKLVADPLRFTGVDLERAAHLLLLLSDQLAGVKS